MALSPAPLLMSLPNWRFIDFILEIEMVVERMCENARKEWSRVAYSTFAPDVTLSFGIHSAEIQLEMKNGN